MIGRTTPMDLWQFDFFFVYIKNGSATINPLVPSMFCFLDDIRITAETQQTADRKFILRLAILRQL